MQSLNGWTVRLGLKAWVGVIRSHIYKKKKKKSTWTALGTKTSNGNLAGSRKWIPYTHTKANKCLHLGSNSQQAPFWAAPIGLVIHSKVAAVRRKVALPLRRGCVCVSEVDLGLSAWMEEGGAAKCPAGALFRVALWAQQAAVSLNNPALVWPDKRCTASQWNHHAVSATSIGVRFQRDLMVQSASTHPRYCYALSHWSRGRRDSYLLKKPFAYNDDVTYKINVPPEYHKAVM